MLSVAVLGGARGADYYLNKVARGVEDYYLGAGEAPGHWLGAAKHRVGLTGQVHADALRTLLDGRDPATCADLLAQRRTNRVPGYDLTFNAPKSISLLSALGPPETAAAFGRAHDRAVAAAFGYLERQAGHVRRGKDGAIVEAGHGLVGAAFRHRVSRAGDPHLHTHVLLANVAPGSDGRYYAVDGRAIYRQAKTAGMLYRAHLRYELRDLGLAWTVQQNGLSEVTGIPAEVLRAFSRRRVEIEARLDELGLDGARAAQVATLDTRRPKHTVDGHRLAGEWHERADELGFDDAARAAVLNQHEPGPIDRAGETASVLSAAGLTSKASSFDRRNVLQALCVARTDGDAIPGIEADADRLLARDDVVPLAAVPDGVGDSRPAGHGDTRYTTTELLAVETQVLQGAAARDHDDLGIAPSGPLRDTLTTFPDLNPDQRRALVRLVTAGSGVDVLVGPAGAGKTFTLAAAHHAWLASNHHVVGAAVAARAAARLAADTGIPSWTVTRLLADLENPAHGPLPDRTVIVVDEAGMLGSRDLARLHTIAARDQAKLVLVGDHRQLPEIDAGGLFRALVLRQAAITLTHNERQAEPWERATLAVIRDAAPPHVRAALAEYLDRGRITVAADVDAARQTLVDDWWRTLNATAQASELGVAAILRESPESHVILAVRRRAVRDLNLRARTRMADAGLLGDETLTVIARGLGERTFAVGDIVVARRNDYRSSGLLNSDLGRVVELDDAQGQLTVERPDGTRHAVAARYLRSGGLDHGYAHTLHRAQGLTADYVFVEANDALYRESLYTGLSRGRISTQLYATGPDPEYPTKLLREEHHPVPVERSPLDALNAAATASRAQHAATDLLDGTRPNNETAVLRANRAALDTYAAVADRGDASRGLEAAYRPHDDHIRQLGYRAERHARAGNAPHLIELLGPPPQNAEARRIWRTAVADVEAFRARWHVQDPDALGRPPRSDDPAARHDDWHQARAAARAAAVDLGRQPNDGARHPMSYLTQDPGRMSAGELRTAWRQAAETIACTPPDPTSELQALERQRAEVAARLDSAHGQFERLSTTPRRQRAIGRRRRDHRDRVARVRRSIANYEAAARAVDHRLADLTAQKAKRERAEPTLVQATVIQTAVRREIDLRAARKVASNETAQPHYLANLGPVPTDSPQLRGQWRRAAHRIEVYRIEHGVVDPERPLGLAPREGDQRQMWTDALREIEDTRRRLGVLDRPNAPLLDAPATAFDLAP